MEELKDLLKHTGVLGMKWGVVNWRKPGGKSGEKRERGRNRMRQEWDSMKRERHWNKVMSDFDNMSTKDIAVATRRAQLENEFKRLAKSKVAKGKDKKDYRSRDKMSNEELNRKVGRLRAKNSLSSQSDIATKDQRDAGKRIAQTGGSILLKMAINKKLTAGDVYESVTNPKAAQTQAIKTILDLTFKQKR